MSKIHSAMLGVQLRPKTRSNMSGGGGQVQLWRGGMFVVWAVGVDGGSYERYGDNGETGF